MTTDKKVKYSIIIILLLIIGSFAWYVNLQHLKGRWHKEFKGYGDNYTLLLR